MATTDISLVNNVVSITIGDGRSRQYSLEPATYAFNERDELQLQINGSSFVIPLADLRIGGSTTAPVSTAAALTLLSSVFPTANESSGGSSYLVYTALLTQTGTDAPVATVLENTLGDTVVWSYVSTGKYRATLLGAFPLLKTFTILGGGDSASFYSSYNEEDGAPSNSIMIEVYDVNINNVDNELINSSIEIRVYPA